MIRLLSCLAALILLASCSPESAQQDSPAGAAPRVKLALNWFPEAQHGGYYAAQLQGLYQQAGVHVDILEGGPDAPVVQLVATGRVQFGLTNADGVINARAAGAPVVALFAPYQINPRCIVVHESTGIMRVEDLADVTLALSQRPAFSHYLRKRFSFPDVVVVPYHGSVTPFLEDARYAMQGYVFSEPVVARRMGADARALMVADTGFNPYASALITTEQMIREQPDLVAAVVQASITGWANYLEAPVETNRHIHSLRPDMDMEILAIGADLSKNLVVDDVARAHGIGHMSQQRWELLTAQMVEAGVIEAGQVQPGECFTVDFLSTSPSP